MKFLLQLFHAKINNFPELTQLSKALPIVDILTLAATGSEYDSG